MGRPHFAIVAGACASAASFFGKCISYVDDVDNIDSDVRESPSNTVRAHIVAFNYAWISWLTIDFIFISVRPKMAPKINLHRFDVDSQYVGLDIFR